MTRLSYDRLCDEIVTQTDLLGSVVGRADATSPSARASRSTGRPRSTPSTSGWSSASADVRRPDHRLTRPGGLLEALARLLDPWLLAAVLRTLANRARSLVR